MAMTGPSEKRNQDKVHDFKTICVFEQFVRRKNVNHDRRNVKAMKNSIDDVNSSRYEPANCLRLSIVPPQDTRSRRVSPSSCFSISTTTSAPGIINNLSSESSAKTPTPTCSHITRNSRRQACWCDSMWTNVRRSTITVSLGALVERCLACGYDAFHPALRNAVLVSVESNPSSMVREIVEWFSVWRHRSIHSKAMFPSI